MKFSVALTSHMNRQRFACYYCIARLTHSMRIAATAAQAAAVVVSSSSGATNTKQALQRDKPD